MRIIPFHGFPTLPLPADLTAETQLQWFCANAALLGGLVFIVPSGMASIVWLAAPASLAETCLRLATEWGTAGILLLGAFAVLYALMEFRHTQPPTPKPKPPPGGFSSFQA